MLQFSSRPLNFNISSSFHLQANLLRTYLGLSLAMVTGVLRHSLQLLLFTSVINFFCNAQNGPRCYLPDGSLNTEAFACNVTAVEAGKHSSCCKPNDTCLSSGVCHQAWSGNMYRMSCTDRDWKDPACPQFCIGKDKGKYKLILHIPSFNNSTDTYPTR